MSLATKIKKFNHSLALDAELPGGVAAMNPYTESKTALQCSDAFYEKFYSDTHKRRLILGINPGRFGSGLTGVAFTDFKRLRDECGIDPMGQTSHEPSSEFIYRMIGAMGGVTAFYSRFYINSICPLGFVRKKENDKWVNYNYYDDPALYEAVKPFIVRTLNQQIKLGMHTDTVVCMGKKNAVYLNKLNEEYHFFERIAELPHPRFIVQYQRRRIDEFVQEYVQTLTALIR